MNNKKKSRYTSNITKIHKNTEKLEKIILCFQPTYFILKWLCYIQFLNYTFFYLQPYFTKKISTSCNTELFRFYDNRTNSRFSCLVICTNWLGFDRIPYCLCVFYFSFQRYILGNFITLFDVFSTNIHIHIPKRMTNLGLIGYLQDRTS